MRTCSDCPAPITRESATGRCKSCANRARRAGGMTTPTSPEVLERIRFGIAEGLSAREVAEQVGMNRKTVLSVAKKRDLGNWRIDGAGERAIPAGFAAFYLDHPSRQVEAEFKVGHRVIRRWAERLGIKREAATVRIAPSRPRQMRGKPASTNRHVIPDVTLAGRAADFLRRYGAVYRCTERGGADPKGTHWRRGSTVLTAAELIERAEGLGFEPDGWKAIAA